MHMCVSVNVMNFESFSVFITLLVWQKKDEDNTNLMLLKA